MDFKIKDLGEVLPFRITDSGLILATEGTGSGGVRDLVVSPDGTRILVPPGIGEALTLIDAGLVLCRDPDLGETVWLFDSSTQTTDSFALPGYKYVWPEGINSRGDVVGSVAALPDSRQRLGWIRSAQNGTVSWIWPTITPVPAGAVPFLYLNAINDAGHTVGTQGIWIAQDRLEVPIWFDGAVHQIGSPAYGAEGDLITSMDRMRVAFTMQGKPTRRATFDATTTSLTFHDWYVVDMTDAAPMLTFEGGEFCYRTGGKAHPIEPSLPGWSGVYCKAMNKDGLIVGFGEISAQRHGFLIEPVWNPFEDAQLPELVARILSGVVNDAGGLEIVGRAVRRVPPRAPTEEVLRTLPDELAEELARIIEALPRHRPFDEPTLTGLLRSAVRDYRQAQLHK